jgi:uncharacterized protein (TIGR02996 family)
MSDEIALLDAIASHPEEDTPRLIYADWLDEHGQHIRAEFIRVQMAVALADSLSRPEQDRHVRVYKRNQELLDNHRKELFGPLAMLSGDPRGVWIEFRRGFISSIELPVGQFLDYAAILAGLRPLPDVRVTEVAAKAMDFVRCPNLGVVTELRAFTYSESAGGRRPDEIDICDAAERLTRLAVLDLENCWLGDWVCDLIENAQLPALTDLNLYQNTITDAGVDNLLRTQFPCQLKRLILGGNGITDDGAIALASQWPTGDADRLEYLNLRFTGIGQTGQRVLLNRFGGRVDLF